MATTDLLTQVIPYQKIVYLQTDATLIKSDVVTQIVYGNKISITAGDEFEYFTQNFNVRGDGSLTVRLANKDFNNTGTNDDYAALNIKPIRSSTTSAVIEFEVQAPDGGANRYFDFLAPGATESTIRLDESLVPTATGTDIVVAFDGRIGKKVSSIRYKTLMDSAIPQNLFENIDIKEFQYKFDAYNIDGKKTRRIGVIAEEIKDIIDASPVTDLEGVPLDILNTFVNINPDGVIQGINTDALMFKLIDEMRNTIADNAQRIYDLENPLP